MRQLTLKVYSFHATESTSRGDISLDLFICLSICLYVCPSVQVSICSSAIQQILALSISFDLYKLLCSHIVYLVFLGSSTFRREFI